jgi:regulator of sigma E protease
MTTIINILLFIVILGVLVFVHEFGHFITAKKNGVFIHEFSIGMGPAIKTIKGKDGIDYSIRALPIGGYVQMAGEIYEDDDTKTVPKDKFMCNKKWWQRLIILCAGVFNNFLLAIILLFVIALFWGAQSLDPTIDHVVEGSAIAKTQVKETVYDEAEGKEVEIITDGIVDGDRIVAINGKKVKTWDKAQLLLLLKDKDNTYDITVKHQNGKKATYSVTPEIEKDEKGNERAIFGIQMEPKIKKGFLPALKYGIGKFVSISEQMWLTLGSLFTGKLSINNLSGPVGIYTVVGETRKAGIASILYLTAYLSLNLGIMNILPIPALDGGHVLFLLIEMITKKKVNAKVESITTTIFFFLLIALMIYISIHDVITLIL